MESVITTIWSGLSVGAIYGLVAMAYNIGLLTSGVLNFAQAQFVGIALFAMYLLFVSWQVPVIVAIIVTVVVVTIFGLLQEELTIRPVPRDRLYPTALITTIGASLVISSLVGHLAGQNPYGVPLLGANTGFSLLGGAVQPSDLLPIAVAIVAGIGLELMRTRTTFGLAGSATAEDREAATLRGINYRRMVLLSFAIGGVLAAVAGIASVAKTYAAAGIADGYVVKAFVCLALFGFGSQKGALAGGAVVGLVEAFSSRYFGAQYSNLSVMILLLAVLMIRPGGVFNIQRGLRLV
jgi:branched-chain amino acid transport system permease protein